MSKPEFSRLFQETFMRHGGGAPLIDCGCGRTNFGTGADHLDVQLERARTSTRYVHHATDVGVMAYEILGRIYVWGCPCEWAAYVEQQLWDNRAQILEYIKGRSRTYLRDQEATLASVAAISGKGDDEP
jgi:hypothetical protein